MLYDSRHRSRLVVGQQLLLHHDRAFLVCKTCAAKTVDFLLLCLLLPLRGSHPWRDLLLFDKNRFRRFVSSRNSPADEMTKLFIIPQQESFGGVLDDATADRSPGDPPGSDIFSFCLEDVLFFFLNPAVTHSKPYAYN